MVNTSLILVYHFNSFGVSNYEVCKKPRFSSQNTERYLLPLAHGQLQLLSNVWLERYDSVRVQSIKASFFTEFVLTLSIEHQVETCQLFESWKIIKSGKQTKVTKVRRYQAKIKYSPFTFQISACQRNTLELVQKLIWTTIPTNVTLIIVNLEVTTSLIQDLAPRVTWITMPIK